MHLLHLLILDSHGKNCIWNLPSEPQKYLYLYEEKYNRAKNEPASEMFGKLDYISTLTTLYTIRRDLVISKIGADLYNQLLSQHYLEMLTYCVLISLWFTMQTSPIPTISNLSSKYIQQNVLKYRYSVAVLDTVIPKIEVNFLSCFSIVCYECTNLSSVTYGDD